MSHLLHGTDESVLASVRVGSGERDAHGPQTEASAPGVRIRGSQIDENQQSRSAERLPRSALTSDNAPIGFRKSPIRVPHRP